ncbi:MAG: ATP-dependent DNA helicase RecG [Elusimicrobiaceae bacterium]|nr:ATP-dependent DNA helicase RecG [Elusimicrobiaceae bacterium]
MADIKYIKGVGPAKSAMFNRLDIFTTSDLLHYYARTYQDRRPNKNLNEFKNTQSLCFKAQVLRTQVIPAKSIGIFKAFVQDDKNNIFEATWFKRRTRGYDVFAQIKKDFSAGSYLWLVAKREDKNSFISNKIIVEEYYKPTDPDLHLHADSIVPIYALTQGLTNKFFRQTMAKALGTYLEEEKEVLPPDLIKKRQLLTIKQALKAIHFPASLAELENARRRMVYEEFLLMSMAWAIKQKQEKIDEKEHRYQLKKHLLTPFKESLPFTFTKAQTRVINEIFKDMLSPKPMTRLLQGDVGSGKTIVALSALLLAAENNFQAAFMAPTEILATQHFITLKNQLKNLKVKVEILTSKTTKKNKEKILKDLSEGKIDILVGTHALIEDKVKFKNLRFIVIDEQHRFGVKQRAKLRAKARHIDMLSMTATPIPRTFALALYGDLAVSTLDELPPNRQPIETLQLNQNGALELLKEEVKKGRQGYIVFPLIDESDKLELKAAKEEFEKLKIAIPEIKFAMIHGQMNGTEKQKIMEDFLNKKSQVLVATPVIEVGIDVKNASIMIIQNAERFGLASLHQLRGRVGRGEAKSICVLVAQHISTLAKERLDILCQTTDGFKIGQKDLALRGPGEILGTRQSGEIELKNADLIKDKEVLEEVVQDKEELFKQDPLLMLPEHQSFKKRLQELYQKYWAIIDLG